MHVRYTGPDQARDLALPGGFITFPQGEWVDIDAACDTASIARHHLAVIIPNLGPDWEAKPTKPSKPAPDKES